MSEREAAAKPKCPNKCEATLRPVISDDPTVERWQCGNIDCMRNFSTPRPGFGPSPLHAVREEEVVAMATGKAKLKCKWCGKPYKHQARLDTHEAECEKIGRSGETRAPRPPRAAKPSSNGDGKVFELALAPLRARREELLAEIPELQEIDSAIAAIEKCRGGVAVLKTLRSAA